MATYTFRINGTQDDRSFMGRDHMGVAFRKSGVRKGDQVEIVRLTKTGDWKVAQRFVF